jgi:hypothetical protein
MPEMLCERDAYANAMARNAKPCKMIEVPEKETTNHECFLLI